MAGSWSTTGRWTPWGRCCVPARSTRTCTTLHATPGGVIVANLDPLRARRSCGCRAPTRARPEQRQLDAAGGCTRRCRRWAASTARRVHASGMSSGCSAACAVGDAPGLERAPGTPGAGPRDPGRGTGDAGPALRSREGRLKPTAAVQRLDCWLPRLGRRQLNGVRAALNRTRWPFRSPHLRLKHRQKRCLNDRNRFALSSQATRSKT